MKKTNWMKSEECAIFFKENKFIKIEKVEFKDLEQGKSKPSDKFTGKYYGYRMITYTEIKK